MGTDAEDDGLAPTGRWGALAFRDFQLFWAHGLFQGLARNMRDFLTYYLVFDLTGNALDLGITGLFQGVPILAFGLLGGALADAVDRKKLLVYTQAANAAALAVTTALLFTDLVALWHLWALTSFSSAVNVLGRPAQRAFLPRLVPRSHIMNGITWFGALSQGTLMGGPLAAAALVAAVGFSWAFAVNAAILLVAVAATVAIRASGRQEGEPRRVSLGAVWEGARYLRKREVLFGSFLMDFGVMSFGFFRPLMPLMALEVYAVGAYGLGLLSAAPAAGSILGTLILLVIRDPQRKGVIIVLANFGYAAGLVAVGLLPWFAAGLLIFTFLGLMDVVSFTTRQALIQLAAPDRFRGRVGSFSSILAGLGNSAGAAEIGALAAVVGGPLAFIINGCVGLSVTGASTLGFRGIWRYDQRAEPVLD